MDIKDQFGGTVDVTAAGYDEYARQLRGRGGIQSGIETSEPANIFTETAAAIAGHTDSINHMASSVRRCCDLLVGSGPEQESEGKSPGALPHQIPRLNQALSEQAEALQYLQNQLLRLDAALAGNTPR